MATMFMIFVSVFLAELGTDSKVSPFQIFLASAGALVVASAIAVLAGTFAKTYLQQIPLKLISGICFILIGLWTIYSYYKG